jgi:hypothetical protein
MRRILGSGVASERAERVDGEGEPEPAEEACLSAGRLRQRVEVRADVGNVVQSRAIAELAQQRDEVLRFRVEIVERPDDDRRRLSRLVEPSMSVNRKLTVPAGSSAMAHMRMVRRGENLHERREAPR